MEKYTVETDVKASDALYKIYEYYKENASLFTAEKVYNTLIDVIESLENMPTGYPIEHNASNEEVTLRYALKWKYRIVFFTNEDTKHVIVVDIVHSSRDLKTYFSKADL